MGVCWILWLSWVLLSFSTPFREDVLFGYLRDLAIVIVNLFALVTMIRRKGIARRLGIVAFATTGTQTAIYLGTILRMHAITGDLNLPMTIALSATSLGAFLLLGIGIFSKDVSEYFFPFD
jgi:hypothetical protein